MIERAKYIDKIKPFVDKSIIKVLTGQRRVGKSYLLRLLMDYVQEEVKDANIIYINCEDIAFDFLDSALALNDYIVSESVGKNYIFIDEIQEIPEFEKAIRSLLLDDSNDIYITGSNANMLSGELATMLSGRYIAFEIFSLSYLEFLRFHELKSALESYRLYARYGGLPYLKHLNLSEHLISEYLNSIYNTILYRDVVSRHRIRNTDFLEKLVRFIADNIGSLFSAKKISDYLKSQKVNISVNVVQQFVSHLKNAFIIQEVPRYDIKGKKLFEIGRKYYFTDIGLRNTIAGFRIEDGAKILENTVYNHLRYLGYKVYVGVLNQLEVDFVCERNNEKIYIQVAQYVREQKTIDREFGNLMKIDDHYPKYVVSEEVFDGNTYAGIRHINIVDFLAKEDW